MKEREDRKAMERWVGVKFPASQCKQCAWAYPDTKWTVGAEKGNCEIYIDPAIKPPDVLRDKAKCDYFEEKSEE